MVGDTKSSIAEFAQTFPEV